MGEGEWSAWSGGVVSMGEGKWSAWGRGSGQHGGRGVVSMREGEGSAWGGGGVSMERGRDQHGGG